jgi:hypothetical protein
MNTFHKSLEETKWYFFENVGKPLVTELREIRGTFEELIELLKKLAIGAF